ncbi:cupin domain-containing protein [Henriciella marina]|uniref:Cupin domain-containing protein n=1 Tax=Henriciella marina TaxID=453851 RepID=A0ABT4LZB8_9PROT|nr:cupin domain-containing protein [Henriciella marina]MCZ4299468.1 cupin domain-containing protein [Henriciella marina]
MFRIILGGVLAFGAGMSAAAQDHSAHAQHQAHDEHSEHEEHAANHQHHHTDKLVSAETGATVENPFHPVRLLLSSEESMGEVTIYEFILPPKSPGSPPHTHSQEDEYFYVLEGTLDLLSEGSVKRISDGDFAALKRGNAHMFWNGSDTETQLLMITTGASFEQFLQSVSPRLAEGKPTSPEAVGAVIGQLAAEHGIEISMEMMPAAAAPYYAPPEPE